MRYLFSPYKRAQAGLLFTDLLVAGVAVLVGVSQFPTTPTPWLFMVAWPALMALALFVAGGYEIADRGRSGQLSVRVALAAAAAALVGYPLMSGYDRDRLRMLAVVVGVSAVSLGLLRRLHQKLHPRPRQRAVFLLFSSAARRRFEDSRDLIAQHYEIGPVVSCDDQQPSSTEIATLLQSGAPYVVCDFDHIQPGAVLDPLIAAQIGGTQLLDFVPFYASVTGRIPLELVDYQFFVRAGFGRLAVRSQGRVEVLGRYLLGGTLLVLAAPLLAVAAAWVWVDVGRPLFFRQERLGHHKAPFTLLKFRTMTVDAEEDGPQWAQHGDPRVTRSGRILRKTRIDELPQLLNLLRGEIALIGPRPMRRHFAELIASRVPFFDLRFLYPPGLTGFPQVLGPKGENPEQHAVKVERDLYYFVYGSIIDDLYLLVKTIQVMLRGDSL